MGSKTKNTTTTDQTSTAAPPSWALPQMQTIANGIMAGLGAIQSVPAYTGDFVAQPGAIMQSVPQAYLDAAATAKSLIPVGQNAIAQLGTQPTFDISGQQLQGATQGFAANNPGGMDAAVRAAIDPVYRNLTESILPSLQSSALDAGAYNSSRALTTLPELALRDFDTQAGNIAAQLRYQDYNDAAQRTLDAYNLATGRGIDTANVLTQRLGLTPDLMDAVMRMSGGAAELTNQAGTVQQANSQAAIDNALQQYQYAIQQPFMGYDIATNLITQLAGNYGTTNTQGTTTQVQKTGGLAPIIGGALGAGMGLLSLPMGGGGSLGGSLVSQLFGKKG